MVVAAALLAAAIRATRGAWRAHRPRIFQGWPNSARPSPSSVPLPAHIPGNYLAEDYDVPAYYLREHHPLAAMVGHLVPLLPPAGPRTGR